MTVSREFLAGLPKAELHVHHVGSASPRIVAELAARHPGSPVPADPGALTEYFKFSDFAHFIDIYLSVVELIKTPEDVRLLTYEIAREMAEQQNLRYAELTVTPYTSVVRGIPAEAFCEAIEDARIAAEKEFGLVLRWIFDISGEAGIPAADETLRIATEIRPEGLVGFGLGGPEIGVPRPQFQPHFEAAVAAGLHSVPHAGETTGPQTIWDAVRVLGAERIGHGTSTMQDPELVEYLRRAPDPAGGQPDVEHRHPRGRVVRRPPAARDGRRRAGRHDQLRRPADVRHRPHQRVRRRRRGCSTWTRPARPSWRRPPYGCRSPTTR